MSAQILILRNTQLEPTGIQQCIECTMHDALRTDIHPSTGRHLPIIGNSHLSCFVPIMLIVEHAYHHRVGNDNTGCIRTGMEKPQRMSGLNDKGLFTGHHFKVLLYQPILHPVLTHLPGLTISNKFVGIKSNIKTEIIVNHHLKSFALNTVPPVFINGFSLEITGRTKTVSINTSACS